jgi:hypothetical protein
MHEDYQKLHNRVMATDYPLPGIPEYDAFYHLLNDYKWVTTHEEAAALVNRCIVTMAQAFGSPEPLINGYTRLTSLCHWRARELQNVADS